MNWFKRNINGILGTVIFHLVLVIVAMLFEFKSQHRHLESYMYIEAEFLEEFEDKTLQNRQKDIDGVNLERMIAELRNVGTSQRKPTTMEDIESMSLEEIRRQYEEQILREKYGDDYDKMVESTYRDLINESDNYDGTSIKDRERLQEPYSGPALVFVELDNEERGNVYVHVPVFTCREGGIVVIDIVVAPDGTVIRTSVNSVKGSGDTSCIVNEARTSAEKSRFQTLASSNTETGKITYHFIQQ